MTSHSQALQSIVPCSIGSAFQQNGNVPCDPNKSCQKGHHMTRFELYPTSEVRVRLWGPESRDFAWTFSPIFTQPDWLWAEMRRVGQTSNWARRKIQKGPLLSNTIYVPEDGTSTFSVDKHDKSRGLILLPILQMLYLEKRGKLGNASFKHMVHII